MTRRRPSCYVLHAVRFSSVLALSSVGLLLGASLSLPACQRVRASSVPLGGVREAEQPVAKAPSAGTAAASGAESDAEAKAAEKADDSSGTVPAASASAPSEPEKPLASAPAGAFTVRPYASGQTWTRVMDAEFTLQLGPGMDVRIVNHQEARFEVQAASGGTIDRLGLEYPVDTSKTTVMGRVTDEPQPLAGKRYVVTFTQGKAEIKAAGGGTPTKKELDYLRDDAREPEATAVALRELAALTSKGKGDFSAAGAIALAGGEDDDTKITGAKASLRQLSTGSGGARLALLDLAYTMIGSADDDIIVEMQVAGTMSVLDAPARYQSATVSGPVEVRPKQPGGMEGKGSCKVSIAYR